MTAPSAQKKPAVADWHWKDLLAVLAKRDWSLRQIAIEEGYQDEGSTLGKAAHTPSPKAESILARYAGVEHPMEIWPSRYHRDGKPNRQIGRKPMRGQPPLKATTRSAKRNPQKVASA